jgi:hypothetical protein
MRFQFGGRSGLHGRTLHCQIDRFMFVPAPEEGGPAEYIFGYANAIPRETDEPALYWGADVCDDDNGVRQLTYGDFGEIVVLVPLEANDLFREGFPEIMSACELFEVDSD